MGSSASKASKTAAQAATRQYPTRTPPSSVTASRPAPAQARAAGPTTHPKPHASSTRDEAINADAFDPQLAESLRKLGPVQAAPTYSHSSTAASTTFEKPPSGSEAARSTVVPDYAMNPAVQLLEARRKLSERAEAEFENIGRKSFPGREFVDVGTLKRALNMRSEGRTSDGDIERQLGIRPGILKKLGARGAVSDATAGL